MDAAATGWSEFFVAMAGATAALAGLIIVGMSVNIEKILQSRSIPARAAAAIGALTLAVATSCLGLVPSQPVWLFGLEVLAGAVALWALWAATLRAVLADAAPGRPAAPRYVIAAVAPVLFSAAGGLLLAGSTAAGLGWLAAASVVSIVAGVLFAWIALVEILR